MGCTCVNENNVNGRSVISREGMRMVRRWKNPALRVFTVGDLCGDVAIMVWMIDKQINGG